MVRRMYWTWLLPLLVLETVAQSTMCATSNPASSTPNSNIFQTTSACVNICKGRSAYAVVQFDKCWCSNVAPGSTVDIGNCNKPCPGYPSEMCGGDSQYSYVLLDKSKVEAGSSSPPSAPSSAPEKQPPSSQQQPPSSQQQQKPPSSPPSPPSSDSPSPSEQPAPPPQIITITQTNEQGSKTIFKTVHASESPVEDKTATLRTVTVTGTLAVTTAAAAAADITTPPAAPQGNGGARLKQGTIAGIAVGGSAAGVFMGLIAVMLWRRNRYRGGDDGKNGGEEVDGGVSYFGPVGSTTIRRDNTSASEDSRMEAFGQNKNLYRNSIGSLEDASADSNQVLRVVNPDLEEKM